MVLTDLLSTCCSGSGSFPSRRRCNLSADSWMGVSGFLISCASRRATSPQACRRWAVTMWEMSSKTSKHALPGRSAPRNTSVVCPPWPFCINGAGRPISRVCCQWSTPASMRRARNSRNCRSTSAPKFSKPAISDSRWPWYCSSGTSKIRDAPGLDCRRLPSLFSTTTPAVRLSKMVCTFARAASNWPMLVCTVSRASDNCWVISAKARVKPPSSSLPCMDSLGRKSPAATWLTPSVSTSKGLAIWLPKTTAINTAANTAINRLRVRVPMYMRLSPSRPRARSWYSRLARSTAQAFATRLAGSVRVTNR